jgi:NAD(P)-dependent dehydrogenase (short-subunit alcohol dehydrogenase family)
MPRVFFITGTSTGFGNNLVQEVLDRGDIAVATARKPEFLSFKATTEKADLSHSSDLKQLLTNSRTT